MTGKNLVKKIAFGTAVIASLLGGVNAYAQTKNPEVIATFEYTSHRPEKEYNGKTYQYNILSDGTICQTDKPNTKFAQTWFYDVDGDGKFTEVDLAARKSGKLIYMHPDFNKKANSEIKRVLENMVQSKHIATAEKLELAKETLGKEVGGYPYNEKVEPKNDYNPKLDEPELKKEKNELETSSVIGVNASNADSKWDNFGASLGRRFYPFRNKQIGLGGAIDLGFGPNKEVDSYEKQLSRGKMFYGDVNEANLSLGVSAELQLYNFIVGGGLGLSGYLSETNERVIRNNEITESNKNSEVGVKLLGKVYGGVEFNIPKTKGWRAGATIGYTTKNQVDLGVRVVKKLKGKK
jgi:hypothetical protein